MLEIGDYSAIADALYLLPFLRSYASFLGFDAGALSARFIGGIASVGKFPVHQSNWWWSTRKAQPGGADGLASLKARIICW